MKKLCYLLSLAAHALFLLIALGADFPVTIQPEPPRVVAVRVSEPPLLFANGPAARPSAGSGELSPAGGPIGAGRATGMAPGAGAGAEPPRGVLPFPAAGKFSLRRSPPGDFRLAPVGKSPDPWGIPLAPAAPPRPLRYDVGADRPGAPPGGPGGVFLLPFDIREKTVAAWATAALARIERNWIIPASARFAFSGRVQVTLTIEKSGRLRALAVEESSLPEALSQAALHAVQASLPLPALPESIAGETFAFTFVFVYNG